VLDVGLAGAIVVVGARMDAETLTGARDRIPGVVVAGLSERRDFLRQGAGPASRARAGAVLVPAARSGDNRPPTRSLLAAISRARGRVVTLRLVRDPKLDPRDTPDPSALGRPACREGRWVDRSARRFRGGVHLRAGLVRR
jgi:hypothetical protein